MILSSVLHSPDLSWRRQSCNSDILSSFQFSATTTLLFLFSRVIFPFSARLTLPSHAPLAMQWILPITSSRHFQPLLMKPISAAWWELLCTCACWSPTFLSHFPNLGSLVQVLLPPSQRLGIHPTAGPAAAAVATLGSASLLEQFPN